MNQPRDWFALQLCFAERVSAPTGLSFEEAVLRFTNCYRRCGLGHRRDAAHPVWQAYLQGLREPADLAAWTADYCRLNGQSVGDALLGCFHYSYLPETRQIRLHFANNDDSGAGPLNKERLPIRRAELHALFVEIARIHPDALTVRGVSWLHGIAAYRRPYPPAYGQSARIVSAEQMLPSMPLWGQFLDHNFRVKDLLAATFLTDIARATTFAALTASFPLQVYAVECDIVRFDHHYGIPCPPISEQSIR